MLLAIDIGNTNISVGLFKGKELAGVWRIQTHKNKTAEEYFNALKALFEKDKVDISKIKGAIICSVVPKTLEIFRKGLKKLVPVEQLVLGENIQAPIENLYDDPKQVGQDRLVVAFAAKQIYGAPVIIVDFGTAVTFDLVSKKGQYLGGIIVPGVETSLDALSGKAALLPKIELVKKDVLLGKNTADSMLSGVLNGYAALTDGVVNKLRNKHEEKAKVIATGGHSQLIATYCKTIGYVDTDIILEGLRLIYSKAH